MRYEVQPAPWHTGAVSPEIASALASLGGVWQEACLAYYADFESSNRLRRKTPKGVQPYLIKAIDRRMQAAEWTTSRVSQGRYATEHSWVCFTFRHAMSLKSDILDAMKQTGLNGKDQAVIIACSRSLLSLISPNDASALTSFEKLTAELSSLGGLTQAPLFLGRLEPKSPIPPVIAQLLQGSRPRGKYVSEIPVARTVEEYIESGESEAVEFKATLRYNMVTGTKDTELEFDAVKAIAGFMNGYGGTLLVGVEDSGSVIGLENDMQTLGKNRSVDGWERALRSALKVYLGNEAAARVRASFPMSQAGIPVAVIEAPASPDPVYFRRGAEDVIFFLRAGNTTDKLNVIEAPRYISSRFPSA